MPEGGGAAAPAAVLNPRRLEAYPPRLLPILYFGAAHLFFVLGMLGFLVEPETLTGFFYQPRTIGLVHLVTLGWISLSILGALYVIGPMALRMPLPARRADYAAFAGAAVGVAGMTGHFLIEEYGGMLWAAFVLAAGFLHVALRVWRGLWSAPVGRAVRLHIAFAFVNLFAAGAIGILVGFHKLRPFLPGAVLGAVHGHAHLAAVGWATLMVVGSAYRLLPMILPASMPRGGRLYLSFGFLQAGVITLMAGFLPPAGGPASAVGRAPEGAPSVADALLAGGSLLVLAGFASFFAQVRWMMRHPRKPPAGLRRPDYGALHAMQAMAYAAVAGVLGLVLALSPLLPLDLEGERGARLATVYGILGLLGFLAQMVVGIGARILPMFAGYYSNLQTWNVAPPVAPHSMPSRGLQRAIFSMWTAAVPLLAAGVVTASAPLVRAGASLLLAAALLGAANNAIVLRHAYRLTASGRRAR